MEHRGKRILYVDYRGLKPEEILPLMKETNDAVAASRGKVLILGNVKGAVVTREVMDYLKKSARMVLRTGRRRSLSLAPRPCWRCSSIRSS